MNTRIEDIITKDLLRQCREGERPALNLLVRTCQTFVFSVSLRLLSNEEDAKDASQETFLRMYRHLHRFDHRVKFTTWLYAIASNICMDKLRARKSRMHVIAQTDSMELAELLADEPALDDLHANRELVRIIGGITATLPETQRLVFVLRDLEDLSIEEVCTITGLSKGSVKSNLHYARRTIRTRLARKYQILEA